jgi:hypothetical protein
MFSRMQFSRVMDPPGRTSEGPKFDRRSIVRLLHVTITALSLPTMRGGMSRKEYLQHEISFSIEEI